MYLIGFIAAIAAAWLMKFIIRVKEKSYFIMELPLYRLPRFSNIGMMIIEKVKVFLFDAGKVIMAISIVLWLLSSNKNTFTFSIIIMPMFEKRGRPRSGEHTSGIQSL